jgi:predicted AlkP superfamily pyrophosphatase or phosphodiesterase
LKQRVWLARTLFILTVLHSGLPSLEASAAPKRPRLVVLIAVDQLRADLLDRYDSLFSGGFRRLRDRGFRFDHALVDHALTNSLPGHVTLSTGAFPSRHGIVNSAWAEKVDGKVTGVFGVSDENAKIVGFPGLRGVSPRRILVDGIADWIRQSDPESRVVAIGTGEYSSLLHAGHTKSETYWFSPEAGRYVTSTYYRQDDPDWIQVFQKREIPRLLAQKIWKSSVPASAMRAGLEDAQPFEFDRVHTTFPHRFAEERGTEFTDERRALAEWIYFTPMIDDTTLRLAEEAVGHLRLGQRGHTDYLSIVVSAVDHIGHRFGPLSLEQLDNLLRLDAELADFFRILDRAIGPDGYVVALSADHGCKDIPEARREPEIPGRRVSQKEIDGLMNAVLDETPGNSAPPEETAERVAAIARRFDFVANAVSVADLGNRVSSDPILDLVSHSVRADRIPMTLGSSRGSLARFGVVAWMKEGSIDDDAPANHGSPYLYDRQVPLIFMGGGIAPGSSSRSARTVDVAPTLAALAGIKVPTAIDGVDLGVGKGTR